MREKNYGLYLELSSSMQDMIDAHTYMIEQSDYLLQRYKNELTSSMEISKFDLVDDILHTDPNRGVKLGKQIGII